MRTGLGGGVSGFMPWRFYVSEATLIIDFVFINIEF